MLALVSCRNDTSVALEEQYFQALARIALESQNREDALEYPFESPFDEDDTKVEAAKDYIWAVDASLGRTITDLGILAPPEYASAAHAAFTAALEVSRSHWDELQTEVEGYSRAQEISRALLRFYEMPEVQVGVSRVDETCGELQRLAAAHDVEVELYCLS
ncbi:MAG: hypothetical protein WEC75_04960 [Dehalococcoidia bacterium]